jgi:hypothetical protein
MITDIGLEVLGKSDILLAMKDEGIRNDEIYYLGGDRQSL